MSDELKKNFSNHRTAIPFGKFELGSEDEFPCNESMVGREGARAKLIDFLTNAGTRKAILVTGRRGMGKTSFVNYCLKEYEEARTERYWRSDVGRTVQALVWLVLVGILATVAFMIGSRILHILLLNVTHLENRFLWIPTILLIIALAFPIFYASKIFSVILKIKLPFSKKYLTTKAASFWSMLLSLVIILLYIGFFQGSGSPIVTISRMILWIGGIYFTGELFTYIKIPNTNTTVVSIVILGVAAIFVFLSFCIKPNCIIESFCYEPIVETDQKGLPIFFSNLLIATVILGLGAFLHATTLLRYIQSVKQLRMGSVFIWAMSLFFIFGILFIFLPEIFELVSIFLENLKIIDKTPELKLFDDSILKLGWHSILLGFSILLIILFILIKYILIPYILILIKKQTNPKTSNSYNYFHFHPSAILAAKAIFFILLSLYALHPVLILITPLEKNCIQSCQWQPSDENFELNSDYLNLSTKRPYCNLNSNTKDKEYCENKKNKDRKNDVQSKTVNNKQKYSSFFPRTGNELTFIGTVIFIVVLIFWIEYEWIIRPGNFNRRDRSQYLGYRPEFYFDDNFNREQSLERPDSTDKDKLNKYVRNVTQDFILAQANMRKRKRDYEELTFLSYFNHFHMSTIISTINLGFEELDHRSVIHAMLMSLREQYYEKFVSLRSPRVLIRTVFGFFVAMILVSDLVQNRFNISPEDEDRITIYGEKKFQ